MNIPDPDEEWRRWDNGEPGKYCDLPQRQPRVARRHMLWPFLIWGLLVLALVLALVSAL